MTPKLDPRWRLRDSGTDMGIPVRKDSSLGEARFGFHAALHYGTGLSRHSCPLNE